MLCYAILFSLALSCSGEFSDNFNHYYPTREQFRSLSSPEGRTWKEWNQECKRVHPGYGLLQRQYREVTESGAGECAGKTVPLGLRLGFSSSIVWHELFGTTSTQVIIDGSEADRVSCSDSDMPVRSALLETIPLKKVAEDSTDNSDIEYIYDEVHSNTTSELDSSEDPYEPNYDVYDRVSRSVDEFEDSGNEFDTNYTGESEDGSSDSNEPSKTRTDEVAQREENGNTGDGIHGDLNATDQLTDSSKGEEHGCKDADNTALDDQVYKDSSDESDFVTKTVMDIPSNVAVGSYDLASKKVQLVSREKKFKCAICQLLPRYDLLAAYPAGHEDNARFVQTGDREETCPEDATGGVVWPVVPEGTVIVKRNHHNNELAVRECARVRDSSDPHATWLAPTIWKEDMNVEFPLQGSMAWLSKIEKDRFVYTIDPTVCNTIIRSKTEKLHDLATRPVKGDELYEATKLIAELVNLSNNVPEGNPDAAASIIKDTETITKILLFAKNEYMIVSARDKVKIIVADLTVASPVVGVVFYDEMSPTKIRIPSVTAVRHYDGVEPYMPMLSSVTLSRDTIDANTRASFEYLKWGIPFSPKQSPKRAWDTDFCMVNVKLFGAGVVGEAAFVEFICVAQGLTKFYARNEEFLKRVSFNCSRWSVVKDEWSTDDCSVTVKGSFEYERYFSCRCDGFKRSNSSVAGGLFMIQYATNQANVTDSNDDAQDERLYNYFQFKIIIAAVSIVLSIVTIGLWIVEYLRKGKDSGASCNYPGQTASVVDIGRGKGVEHENTFPQKIILAYEHSP